MLTTDFRPRTGGIAEYLHHLWNGIAQEHDVTVLSTVPAEQAQWEHAYDLRLSRDFPERRTGELPGDRLPPTRALQSWRHRRTLRRAARALVSRIVAEGEATVYVGSWGVTPHFWCEALRRAGVPYGIYAYGAEITRPLGTRLGRWRRTDLRHAREVIACSSGTARLVSETIGGGVSVRVVRPGVAAPPAEEAIAGRVEELGLELGLYKRRVLLTVGRLVPRKGIDLVLYSVAALWREFRDLRYVVVGDGPEFSRLQARVDELGLGFPVVFVGSVDEVTKWALYRAADLFVMPNRLLSGTDWEGFGIVFLEAAVMGTPAVGGDNGGVPDAVVHGATGLLVDPEDPSSLTEALRRLLHDEDLRLSMGEEARERARTEFDWRRIAAGEIRRLNELS